MPVITDDVSHLYYIPLWQLMLVSSLDVCYNRWLQLVIPDASLSHDLSYTRYKLQQTMLVSYTVYHL